jgi:hypothetical protein
MLTEEEIHHMADAYMRSHGLVLDGWSFEIRNECNSRFAYTDFETKTIILYREPWPTLDRNIKDSILHEIAHALCGYGEHDLKWWDLYLDIGGKGVWVEHPEKIRSVGVRVTYK